MFCSVEEEEVLQSVKRMRGNAAKVDRTNGFEKVLRLRRISAEDVDRSKADEHILGGGVQAKPMSYKIRVAKDVQTLHSYPR